MPKFITFEGIDGSGKSTQAYLLHEYLTSRNIDNVLLKAPGGTDIGMQIRNILKDRRNSNISRMAALMLFMADFHQSLDEVIEPALNEGKVVIVDRWIGSTRAYQIYGMGVVTNKEFNDMVSSLKLLRRIPDLTIYLDVSIEVSAARIRSDLSRTVEGDMFEETGLLTRALDGYKNIAKSSSRWATITHDDLSNPMTIAEKIRHITGY